MEWRELPGKKESQIKITFEGINIEKKGKWPEQHRKDAETLEAFHRVFSPRIKTLDASEWASPDKGSQSV